MKVSSRIAIGGIALLIGACATEYQSSGATGGFKDTQLAPDVFRVSFTGNGFTSPDRVQDFALLRAAEITLANNARYFAVMSSKDQTRTNTYVTAGTSYTKGNTTTYTAPQVQTYYTPGVGMTIRTFQAKPKGGFAFDAEFLARSIRTKYQIK
jgi:hypothetical protein